jgi:hypothetical protein
MRGDRKNYGKGVGRAFTLRLQPGTTLTMIETLATEFNVSHQDIIRYILNNRADPERITDDLRQSLQLREAFFGYY